jgi:hypothetical protein
LISRRTLALAMILAVAVGITAVVWVRQGHRGGRPAYAAPGDEVSTAGTAAYGWSGSKRVGTRFTDGLNYLRISPKATGPIKLLSVTPLMDNDTTLRVVGVLTRVVPDMLPPNHQTGWFEEDKGFPPQSYDSGGGRDPHNFIVRQPKPGDDLNVEIQIGFDVVGNGKTNKRGVEVIYQYEGKVKRVVIPSHLSICAPASVKCSPDA